MLKQCTGLLCAAALMSAGSADAVTPRSASYTMEYMTISLGGGTSSSSSYELVGLLDDNGSASPASSSAYSIEPAVGAPQNRATSAAGNWMLFD